MNKMRPIFLIFCLLVVESYNLSARITTDSLLTINKQGAQLIAKGQYDHALAMLQNGISLNNESPNDSIQGLLLCNIGLCYIYQEKYDLSIDSYQAALMITEDQKELEDLQISVLWGLSFSYKKSGNFIDAIKSIDKAIVLADDQQQLKANLYVNAGNLHRKLKDDSSAIQANENAYQIYEVLSDTLKMSMALNNIGNSYAELEDYTNALAYFFKALKFKRITKARKKIASTLNNIGDLYLKMGDCLKAAPYLKESLQIREELKGKNDLISSLNRMASLSLCKQQLNKAQGLLVRANTLLDSTKFQSERLENLYLFSKLYYLKGNNKKGDAYHLEYTNLNDSLYNELDVGQSILKSERAKLEAEKASAILAADKLVLEEKNKFQQYQIWSSLAIIAALAGLGWNLHRSRNMKKRLAEELSHRTNNNFQLFMSMLGYQKQRFADAEKQELLGEIQNRLSAMASVHKLLKPQQTLYRVNMQEYLDKILTSICFSFGYQTECLNLVIPPIELSMKQANYIGFIANEVATNALKYAFPQSDTPELQVVLSKENNKITLFMQDNGKEIPPHDPNISTSLGMTLIEDFTHSLKGKSHFEHTGEGMLFQLEFSL